MRIRSKNSSDPLRGQASTDDVWVTHSLVSAQDPSELEDYYNKQYAFVVKYQMHKIIGVEISHTSLVMCNKAEFQDYIDKFEEWCTPVRGKSPMGCWKASSRWSKSWTSDVQANLQTSMEQRSYYGGMSSCTEYEFAGDDGVQIIKFGDSMFLKELRRRQMNPAWADESKWGLKWGNWMPAFIINNEWKLDVYPVGPVDKDAVAKAHRTMRFSGSGFDFNPSTYEFWQHNCHHFTEAMLQELKLPYWNLAGGLPSSFMPEKNPVFVYVVGKLVQLFKVSGKVTDTSHA